MLVFAVIGDQLTAPNWLWSKRSKARFEQVCNGVRSIAARLLWDRLSPVRLALPDKPDVSKDARLLSCSESPLIAAPLKLRLVTAVLFKVMYQIFGSMLKSTVAIDS